MFSKDSCNENIHTVNVGGAIVSMVMPSLGSPHPNEWVSWPTTDSVTQLPLMYNPATVLVLMAVTLYLIHYWKLLILVKRAHKSRWVVVAVVGETSDPAFTYPRNGFSLCEVPVGFWLSLQGMCVLGISCLYSRPHCSDRRATRLLWMEEYFLIIGQMKLLLTETRTPDTSCVTLIPSHN